MNWYAYVENAPLLWADPEGLLGWGVGLGETTDVGLVIGAAQTGAVGVGVFAGGKKGLNVGTFASWGAFAGVGGILFITNAANAEQLARASQTVNVNVGWLFAEGGIQVAWDPCGETWAVSYGGPPGIPTGVAAGAAVSKYGVAGSGRTWAATQGTVWHRMRKALSRAWRRVRSWW